MSNSENDYISAPQSKLTKLSIPTFVKSWDAQNGFGPSPLPLPNFGHFNIKYGGSLYVLKLAAHLKTKKGSGIFEKNFIATRYIR